MNSRIALVVLVGGVTALRLVVLALTPTDLFFDEAQYWAWGQSFDWGYFSKPPFIAWVIGITTSLAGSDATFWVRMAAPLFHGATALILAAWIGTIHRPAAIWVAAVYLAMPVLVIGSWMISTDTIMAPFLAAALWGWWRALETRKWSYGALAGGLAGLAMMGKYAGIYFWVAVGVAALFPGLRPSFRVLAAAVIASLVILMPNLIWNFQNGLVTFAHTADNAQVGRGITMNWVGLIEFLASQAIVIGPVFFVLWIGAMRRERSGIETFLLAASVPVLLLVSVQAFVAKANANWAFAAYPAAAALVGLGLSQARRWRLFAVGISVNAVLILPVTALILWPSIAPDATDRYTGRAEVMSEILNLADGRSIAADERQILADLTYAARGSDAPAIYARDFRTPPRHWYDMAAPLPENEEAVYVSDQANILCDGREVSPLASIAPEGGAYSGRRINLFPLPATCP